MRSALLFFLTIGFSHSIVDFTHSALYDIYDFKGVDRVPIDKCDFGCLIFAATLGETFSQFPPDNLDPYASNLYIVREDGMKISVAKLAQQRDAKNKKIPLTISGKGNISIINENNASAFAYFTIAVYVVEKTKAEEFSYEVYDYYYSRREKIISKTEIVTIMSAYAYRIQAEQTIRPNSVTARLVGFDNALDNNKDECPYAYKTPESSSFPGFSIMPGALVSLAIENTNVIELQLDLQSSSLRDLGTDGFITSPGWNGCNNPNNEGFQSFRSRDDPATDVYILSSSENDYNVTMDVLPNFDSKHRLTIQQVATLEKPTVVTGTLPQTLNFPSTHYLLAEFEGMRADQGFLLRFSSTPLPKSTTAPGSSAESTPAITSPTESLWTTSASYRTVGLTISQLMISLLF